VWLAVASVVVVTVAAFTLWPRPVAPGVCVVAIDASETSFAMHPSYRAWLPKVLQACAGPSRGRIIVRQAGSQTQVTADLQSLSYTGSSTDDQRVSNEIRRIAQSAGSLFPVRPTAPVADLVGVALASEPDYTGTTGPRELYMFSSGLTLSSGVTLPDRPLTDDDIAAKVADLPKASLPGVKVHLIGVGGPKLSSERLPQLRAFWSAYYQACGAELVEFTTGA